MPAGVERAHRRGRMQVVGHGDVDHVDPLEGQQRVQVVDDHRLRHQIARRRARRVAARKHRDHLGSVDRVDRLGMHLAPGAETGDRDPGRRDRCRW